MEIIPSQESSVVLFLTAKVRRWLPHRRRISRKNALMAKWRLCIVGGVERRRLTAAS